MKNVQDIYPVSPMQEFMLLHGLSGAKNDTLFNQFVFSVAAELDTTAFAAAWNHVISAHPALRTAFIWQGVETPQQVVRKTVKLKCDVHDFQHYDESAQEIELQNILRDDRNTGFDFRRAPLMRFTLVQFGLHNWRVVWSSHHLILDRWCIDGLMSQFQLHYTAECEGRPCAPARAPSYREYISWIQQQNKQAAFKHWKDYLGGFGKSTTTSDLTACDALSQTAFESSAKYPLGAELTQKTSALSSAIGVTQSCIVQAAIALAFGRALNRADIVFGMTVAGRPSVIHNVEDIVGSFINTLPVRVTLEPEAGVSSWLRQLSGAQFANGEYDYLSQPQLRTCAAISSDQPLFDVLVVWLTQTRLESDQETASDEVSSNKVSDKTALPLVAASEQYATAYPLTLSVIETASELVLRADTASGYTFPVAALLDQIEKALVHILAVSVEGSLRQLEGVTNLESLVSTSNQSADIDVFEATQAAGVAKVKGREDARADVIEDLLRGEWKEALGVEQILDANDDFFELGGDSLKAAAMHVRIESATRKAIPMLALYENPTLQGMTQTLIDEKWPLRAGIAMPLRVSSGRSPLFCIASPEVNTIGYAMLTRHLSSKFNLVLLQAPPDSEDLLQLHPDDLSRVASDYVRALKEIQPEGTYSLLSMCSGSHIALNMVQQLEGDGQKVGFLGVINTWSLYSISWRFYLNRFVNVSSYYAQRINALIFARVRSMLPAKDPVASTVTASLGSSQNSAPLRVLPADSAVGLGNPWISQVGLAQRMPTEHKTHVDVTVFRLADQPYWRTGERELGWKRLTGGAHGVDIPGIDHDSILREPQVIYVAQALEAELERVAAIEDGNKSQ